MVKLIELKLPSIRMTPLPSVPRTFEPETEIELPPNSKEGPPPSRMMSSLVMKLNEAGMLGEPRLQMAKTGSTIAEEDDRFVMGGAPASLFHWT